jgi:hypothetical protein
MNMNDLTKIKKMFNSNNNSAKKFGKGGIALLVLGGVGLFLFNGFYKINAGYKAIKFNR